MSLLLPNFFLKRGYLDNIDNYQMTVSDLSIARAALISDVDAFLLNGLISISSAINSLKKQNYSWAFIQSYYSLFYLARTFNGINDYCIIYKNKKPYGIKIQLSERFEKLRGNSHDVVLNQFKKYFSSDILLNNQIENMSPVDWFNSNRNFINYTMNPMEDPKPPISLHPYQNDLRKWIATYLSDTSHNYTFDPSHCYIAYPIQLFIRIFDYYRNNEIINKYIDEEKLNYFKINISDDNGPIAVFLSRIVDLAVID